jgi:hypothetical protein
MHADFLLLGEPIGWLEVVFAAVVMGLVTLAWRMRISRDA